MNDSNSVLGPVFGVSLRYAHDVGGLDNWSEDQQVIL